MTVPRQAIATAVLAALTVAGLFAVTRDAARERDEFTYGWQFVDYGDARLRVPADWTIYSQGFIPCPDPGMSTVAAPPAVLLGVPDPNAGCTEGSTREFRGMVVERLPSVGAEIEGARSLESLTYDVRVTAVGVPAPIAEAVFASITPSARRQVLETLPADREPPPRGWQTVEAAGIEVAAPGDWARHDEPPYCGLADDRAVYAGDLGLGTLCPASSGFVEPARRYLTVTRVTGGFVTDTVGSTIVSVGDVDMVLTTRMLWQQSAISLEVVEGGLARAFVTIGLGDPEIARRILLSTRRV